MKASFLLMQKNPSLPLAAILALLSVIAAGVAELVSHQRQQALAQEKEALCRETMYGIPNQQPWPFGNAIPPERYSEEIQPGKYQILYGFPFPSNSRWPGPFFQALSEGVGDHSFLVEVESISAGSAVVSTPCSPKTFSVPVDKLFDLTVGR